MPRQDYKEALKDVKDKMKDERYSAAKKILKNVKLKPEVIDPEEPEMLEDFLTIAFNDALAKANDAMESRMNAVTGGMNIPGLGF